MSCCLYALLRFPLPLSPLQTAQHVCTSFDRSLVNVTCLQEPLMRFDRPNLGTTAGTNISYSYWLLYLLTACCDSWVIVLHIRLACIHSSFRPSRPSSIIIIGQLLVCKENPITTHDQLYKYSDLNK